MSSGWIKLHRNLTDWEWYDDKNTSRLFIHLILTVNHKDNNWRGITIKRGSRLTSLDKLSSETSLSVSKIRTAIKKLILTSELTSESHSQHTVFTVKNYDLYQGTDKPVDKPVTNESQTNDKRIATNKNGKKEKNGKEVTNKEFYQQIVDSYNSILTGLPSCRLLTPKRKASIIGVIKLFEPTDYDFKLIETWDQVFNYITSSDFLMSRGDNTFKASFDFITNKTNMTKIIEGNYVNKQS